MPKAAKTTAPKRISLRTIAQACDTSINTVSHILNQGNEDQFSAETVRKVKETAKAMGYRPNMAARMLLSNSSKMIGFVTSTLDETTGTLHNPVVYPFLVGANDYVMQYGYHMVLVGIKEMRTGSPTLPPTLENHFFDGIIMQQGRWDYFREWQESSPAPIIFWDSGIFDHTNCIYRDELAAGRDLTLRLIELGHRKICFTLSGGAWLMLQNYLQEPAQDADRSSPRAGNNLSGDRLHYSVIQRHQGYLEALESHGLSSIILPVKDVSSTAEAILEQGFTAAIIYDLRLYFALSEATRRLGMQIPADLSIANCDVDTRVPPSNVFRLGGLTYDRYEAGQMAGEMMLKALQSSPPEPVPTRRLLGQFQLGDTIGRPRP